MDVSWNNQHDDGGRRRTATPLSMTVLPPVAVWAHRHNHVDDPMGQAKSRIIDILCPGPSDDRDSRSSAEVQSLDGFDYSEDEDAELAASCCRITGGLRTGYSAAASDDVGLAETQMVVVRNRQAAGEAGRATKLVRIAPRVHVAHASVDSDDSGVLFSREIQILRHECGHHRVR